VQVYNTEVLKIPGYATIGILSTGIGSLPETGHGKLELVGRRATKMLNVIEH